jgi:hypothetical protein
LGFDNEYVFKKVLGYSTEAIRELEKKGVIFKWNPSIPCQSPPPEWDGKKGLRNGGGQG